MDKSTRRVHARVSCDRPVEVFSDAADGRGLGVARLLDLSLSGAMVAYDGLLRTGASYHMRIDDIRGTIALAFRVVRESPHGNKYPQSRHYGLSFNLTGSQERVLLELIDAIRAHPTPDEDTLLDRLLRSYWSRG